MGHIHGDIAFLRTKSNYKSILILVDAKTRYIRGVAETFTKPNHTDMIMWITEVQTNLAKDNYELQSIRFDREPAITADETETHLNSLKPPVQYYCNAASEGNLAEQKIKLLREKANRMMHDRQLPHFLEPYAWTYAIQLHNITPTDALQGRTPFQEYHMKTPYRIINRARTFGSVAYHKHHLSDKQTPATPYIFVGFDHVTSGNYRLYNPHTQRISVVHEANFVETQLTSEWFVNLLYGDDLNFRHPLPQHLANPLPTTTQEPTHTTEESDTTPIVIIESTNDSDTSTHKEPKEKQADQAPYIELDVEPTTQHDDTNKRYSSPHFHRLINLIEIK